MKNDYSAKFTIIEENLKIAFNMVVKELIQDETVLSDCMINVAEAIDTGVADEQLQGIENELTACRNRLYELMQVPVGSTYARKQIDEEIQKVIRKSESLQIERDRISTNIERSNLDARQMEEIKAFLAENNPLENFDKDLFRKLIHQVIVHNRNEVEFYLYMGISKK